MSFGSGDIAGALALVGMLQHSRMHESNGCNMVFTVCGWQSGGGGAIFFDGSSGATLTLTNSAISHTSAQVYTHPHHPVSDCLRCTYTDSKHAEVLQ